MLKIIYGLYVLYKKHVPMVVQVMASALIVIGIVKLYFSEYIPFDFFYFWKIEGTLANWLVASWPIFAWAFGVTLIIGLFSKLKDMEKYLRQGALGIMKKGIKTSLWAGISEEIAFRWLSFLAAIAIVQFASWCLFDWIKVIGFFGQYGVRYGFIEVAHHVLFAPIANFFTLGYLHEWIYYQPFHINGWAVGAALLFTNAAFRDGHEYRGVFSWINSWFIGMYLFWIMFSFGILAAIIVHIVYDLCVFTAAAIVVHIRGHRHRRRNRGY